MKNIFLLIGMLVTIVTSNAQRQKKIDIVELVKITGTGDFSHMKNMVASLGYLVLDSSKQGDGSQYYISHEMSMDGNMLGCRTDAKLKIKELTLSIYKKKTYDELKEQIIKLGFKSKGLHKGTFKEEIESEDFEKGNILISTGIIDKGGGWIAHEFTFLRIK
ncbi:MAG TPA: hypothetical protein VK483_05200 [Chitinophagaceae bacterium]|nr:hypothetical protein [Chitinophagaceae bacterium]